MLPQDYILMKSNNLQDVIMTTSKALQTSEEFADTTEVSPSEVNNQVWRLLKSPEFNATDAQRAFLQFVIEKTIAGQTEEIKGYTIATRVFGRREDFDQAKDPIVSIQANKLRRALERYYLVAGQNDPIHITIPKGAYIPVFDQSADPGLGRTDRTIRKDRSACQSSWPTIVILPFENLTGNQDMGHLGIGIATEIALEITRYQEIRVLIHSVDGEQPQATDISARFMLGGSIRKDINSLKVIVNLTDLKNGMQIWADSYRTDLNPTQMIEFEEKIATTVVGMISCEAGVIAKTLSSEAKRVPPSELKTHQAMLRFYQFSLDFSADNFVASYKALRQACRNEPECGLAWSMLSRLYAINYSLELFDLDTPLEKAAAFAEKGIRLEPANQRARLFMAFVLLFKNELAAGLAETDYTLKLNSNSLINLENIGYLMTLFGDWGRGPALIHKAIEQNPYYNTTVHYALWLDWVRQEQYDNAYGETLHFARPTLFWDPLMKAAILGLLGRTGEGRRAGKDLLRCKPDFPKCGRTLIRHYIKCDNIVAKVISGLKKIDVSIV